ncbi:MAG: hypothetical protein AB1925_24125 [Actinomycetota bacterium]
MAELPGGDFDEWNKRVPFPRHANNPERLTSTSVFLYENVVSHVLSEVRWTGWQWGDSPRDVAALLLHVTLPDLAAWWFNESSFGAVQERRPLRQTIDSESGVDSTEGALFLSIASELESILARPDQIQFAAIAGVLDRFNTYFRNASRWYFELVAYPSPKAAGSALVDSDEELIDPRSGNELGPSEWLELCANAGSDPAAAEVVMAVFEDAYSL